MKRADRVVVDGRAPPGLGRWLAPARSDARAALRVLGCAPCELSLALVDDAEMRALNRDWRGKDRTTDVLAFAQGEGEGASPAGLLGDVVVSVPTARRQAETRGCDARQEIRTLLVHGILHLLGHDHERSPADARRMFRLQREVLEACGAPPAARSPEAPTRVAPGRVVAARRVAKPDRKR